MRALGKLDVLMENIETLKEIHESECFKAQKKYFMRLTMDASNAFRAAYSHAIIAKPFAEQSLTIQSTDDFEQSVMAISFLYDEGLLNPIKRELRYIIEASVKYLYIDQMNPSAGLKEKIPMVNKLGSSIDIRKDLKLGAFHSEDSQQFINELYDAYKQCCAYIHLSPKQIEERLAQRVRGGALGYETTEELRKINRLIFRVYDLVLTIYFHAYSLSLSGDLFINLFDRLPEWVFHRGKYIPAFSSYFDYKVERRHSKNDTTGGWNFDNWPPKRFSNA